MTRDDAHKLWHKDSWQIASEIYHKYKDAESRNCTNCKWAKNDVCTNPDSGLYANFVSDSDVCELWENKDD